VSNLAIKGLLLPILNSGLGHHETITWVPMSTDLKTTDFYYWLFNTCDFTYKSYLFK